MARAPGIRNLPSSKVLPAPGIPPGYVAGYTIVGTPTCTCRNSYLYYKSYWRYCGSTSIYIPAYMMCMIYPSILASTIIIDNNYNYCIQFCGLVGDLADGRHGVGHGALDDGPVGRLGGDDGPGLGSGGHCHGDRPLLLHERDHLRLRPPGHGLDAGRGGASRGRRR